VQKAMNETALLLSEIRKMKISSEICSHVKSLFEPLGISPPNL